MAPSAGPPGTLRGGRGPVPSGCIRLVLWFGGGCAVLPQRIEKGRRTLPQHWLPSSWKDAQLDRCQSIDPDVSSPVLFLGTQAQPETSLGSWPRRQGMKRGKQHAVSILCLKIHQPWQRVSVSSRKGRWVPFSSWKP